MEKYVTSLKELIAQSSKNSSEMNNGAKKNDPKSCFQMGMVYLLGINTAIDFKKAGHYFANQSLAVDTDAHRMLGLISELEGDYSLAFKNYAIAAGGAVDGTDNSYIEKVREGRENLRDLLNKWKLPARVLNYAITTVLDDYKKGGSLRENSCIIISAICQDTPSCVDAAKILCDSRDYSGAMQWLHFGNVGDNNLVYQMTEGKLREMRTSIDVSNVLQIIELDGSSLLSGIDIASVFAPAKKNLNEIATRCSRLWRKEVVPKIDTIKKKWEKEEKGRIQKEENEKRHAFNQAEAVRLAEEAEIESRKKKKRMIIYAIAILVVFLIGFFHEDKDNPGGFVGGIIAILGLLFWYFLIKWIVKKFKK